MDGAAHGGDHIQVLVRVRPPNARELSRGYVKALRANPGGASLEILHPAHAAAKTTSAHSYGYDHVCDEHQTQAEVFESVGVPVTDAFLEGYHGCLIAYGQTGAGKTYTMQGPDEHAVVSRADDDDSAAAAMEHDAAGAGAAGARDPEQRGLIPRVLQRIFQRIQDEKDAVEGAAATAGDDEDKENAAAGAGADADANGGGGSIDFTVKCSYLEIYNETVADLLCEDPTGGPQPVIRLDEKKGVFVEGLTEAAVTSAEETYDVFTRGSHNRRVGQTEMNRESSRSHAVFTVSLESRRRPFKGAAVQKRSALLHLVDLAGSERQKSTDSAGERLKEASAINKSLSALGNVIKALVDVADGKERHVPFRDSKLTFLLKEALGGAARCTLLACVSPAAQQTEETLSTLKFAQRAKMVKVKATANEEAVGSAAELAAEVVRLRAQLGALEGGGGSGGGGGGGGGARGESSSCTSRARTARRRRPPPPRKRTSATSLQSSRAWRSCRRGSTRTSNPRRWFSDCARTR